MAAAVAAGLTAACGGDQPGQTPATATASVPVPSLHPSVDGYPDTAVSLAGPGSRRVAVAVKVANTPARRAHGLMEVASLPPAVGMLFTFPDDTAGGFWMKNTLVPLDIAYADAGGDIHTILQMEPCPAGHDCPLYPPSQPYRYALEVAAGWFDAAGVSDEWRLELPDDLPPSS
ncbi:MAG: DUF192 domain-containing protein [Actinobacteria bacterium]|nr:DUF192 domain-containing protein [Actinomycetota bacterium]